MIDSKAMILGCAGTELTPGEVAFFARERPWGFILFARNIGSPGQVSALVASLRESVGWEAPVFIDQEGGRVQRLRPPIAPNYPPAAEIGRLHARDAAAGLRAAWALSRLHAFDLRALGIDADCLPVLDVPVEGAHDVIGNRAYARDPGVVAELGRAAAEGLLAGGVLPVVKHMPGHGRAFSDSHHALPVVDATLEDLRARDFLPFARLSDMPAAMTAHVVYTAIDPHRPATTSPVVIDRIMRGEIGFDGLLMSDDVSMKALSGDFSEKAAAILAAGCDIVLHCNGLMEEMVAVASSVPWLSARPAERAAAALARRDGSTSADEAELRAEFGAAMAMVA